MTDSAQSNADAKPRPEVSGNPNVWDILFLIFLACVLVCVAWVGVLSHEEGNKNEVTKQNGEAWVKWLKDNSEPRLQEDFAIESCAASAMERRRWGDCFNEIMESVKELNGLKNAFTGEPVAFIAKCDPKRQEHHWQHDFRKNCANATRVCSTHSRVTVGRNGCH